MGPCGSVWPLFWPGGPQLGAHTQRSKNGCDKGSLDLKGFSKGLLRPSLRIQRLLSRQLVAWPFLSYLHLAADMRHPLVSELAAHMLRQQQLSDLGVELHPHIVILCTQLDPDLDFAVGIHKQAL